MLYFRFSVANKIFTLILLLISIQCKQTHTIDLAHQGVLDLRSKDLSSSIISLNGDWELYWRRLLEPEDFKSLSIRPDSYIEVPDIWNHTVISGQSIGNYGYATYRLKVILPENSPPLSIKMLDSGSNYRFWVNGQYYGGSGHVSDRSDKSIASYKTALYDLRTTDPELEILVQVSNYHHAKGGIWEPIKLGSYATMHNYREFLLIFEGFLAGSLIIMGLYHIGLYLLRKKDHSTIWFGLFCLEIAVRTMLTGERILHGLLPDGAWESLVKLEYITMDIGPALFLLFLKSLYPSEISLRFTQAMIAWATILSIFVIFVPASVYSQTLIAHQLVVVLTAFAVSYGLVKAIIRHRDGAIVVMLSSVFFILTVFNDILYNQQIVFTFQMVGFGLFIFIFSQSFILSMKFSRAFTTIETMSDNLQRYNHAYSRFVPTEILKFLEKESILDIHLGDQVQAEMTVLFVDIRSFTTMSEYMTPKENFDFLNNYLGRVGPLIRKNNGFIDKYLGDGLMALFPEKAEDAIQAALDIQRSIQEFNNEQSQWGKPPIRIGAGVHTGNLMLGTIGESERMDGTVISDAVNLASRIEGLTKTYGSTIIMSETSLVRLEDPTKFCTRFLGKMKVKGKSEPVSIFEIFDLDSKDIRIIKQVTRTEFEKAIVAMHAGETAEALQMFQAILRANPDDSASLLYERRIQKELLGAS